MSRQSKPSKYYTNWEGAAVRAMKSKKIILIATLLMQGICFASINFGSKESGINLVGGKLAVSSLNLSWDGTLTTSSERNLASGLIDFNAGRLLVNNVPSIISGRLQAAVAQRLRLLGSQSMRFESGPLPARLYVSGTGNRFEGQPIFSNDTASNPNITIDAGAELILALQSVCNGYISLSSSTLILDDNLQFADGKEILGDGAVIANNKSIGFGGSNMAMTGTLRLLGPTQLELNANTRLSSLWIVGSSDTTKEINITGNGNVLDLSLGGTISIGPGVKVALSNIKVKGIGKGGFALGSYTSQLRLSDVQLELENNYTVTCGNVYVNGDVTVVSKNKLLTFSNRGTLTVDGVSLFYDTATYVDNNNIRPRIAVAGFAANIGLINGGTIKAVTAATSGDIVVSGPTVTLNGDRQLSLTSRLLLSEAHTLVDGNGYSLDFLPDDGLVVLPHYGRITFKNITLKRFSPQHIKHHASEHVVQGESLLVRFSDNVTIQLGATKTDSANGVITLPYHWFFGGNGNILLDGAGNTLDISSNINALALVSTSTLTIQNMKLYGVGGIANYGNVRAMNRNGTINMKNLELILTGNYEYFRGYLNIFPDVLVRGVGKKFTYISEKPLTIQDSAIFTLDYGLTFSYDSRDRGGLRTQHFNFATDAATLFLNGSRFHATSVGLQLARGTIFADNAVTLSSEGTSTDNAFVVAPRVNLHVLAAATLTLDGKVLLE